MNLHLTKTRNRHPTLFGRGCAVLLVALVLLLCVLAACPAAHEWFHHDAGHEDHECAVTLFAHGVTTALAVVAVAVVAWRLIGRVDAPKREFQLPASTRLLPPGRAPPVS